ncbi:ABC transporter ATP-binding protein/permease [Pseudoflavonifractor capillosus]|uniref:ABC transporter ATP-binding protein/permease n=1 Tax=Pseudoflavonifractor capillosus TaxID=106588 RepID=UPI0019564BC4|nr:ABC transporter ATP-binding protein/permease [Pseudoflavonifractor capillosus]MBM6693382.1 ABC transporter ATP-binding protein/permease [Pseudoflavonifractor capillosus]
MLKLTNIRKTYTVGDLSVDALRGVSLEFRDNEFVSILGPSGCGKTTTLNIIGGLDRYTSGDLIINGRSTKEYTDSDWDTYRNHSVGFVFQSYNLIPHQTILANVELALTLSGVSKAERHRRAKEALEQVGLTDHMHKRPNQLSGGQMQRVAIARALINNPDILLADEPTGALDSETSVQVMDLLREVAKDRLVIMVTHNPELAQAYSTRIIQLKDGEVIADSNPYESQEDAPALTGKAAKAGKKTSMSFPTALSLSLNNLMTKKGRTFLTAFAGSIGIIGIALILSLSSGINTYITKVQQDTLTSYPITIEAESVDMTSMLTSLMGVSDEENSGAPREEDRVYVSNVMYDMMDSMMNAETVTNNLKAFKEYLEKGGGGITDLAQVYYGYDFKFDIYNKDPDGKVVKSDVMSAMETAMGSLYGGDYTDYFNSMGSMYESFDVWQELLPGEDGQLVSSQVLDQHELLYGHWPEEYNQVILFVDDNNQVSDLMLYALGLVSVDEMNETLAALQAGEEVEVEDQSWSYEELCQTQFKLLLPYERYQYDANTNTYTDLSATQTGLEMLYNSNQTGITLQVVGVARSGSNGGMMSGSLGYTNALTQYAIEHTADSQLVKDQLANPDTDVITNLPFRQEGDTEPTDQEKAQAIGEYLLTLDAQSQAEAYVDGMSQPSQQYVDDTVDAQMANITREDIEKMISQEYAAQMGVDAATLDEYIAGMSDEELFAQVEEAMAAQIKEQYAAAAKEQLSALPAAQLSAMLAQAVEQGPNDQGLSLEQFVYLYDNYMPPTHSDSTYQDNLDLMGYIDLESPSSISLYADTFKEKDKIADLITAYNQQVAEEDQISYTDYVALLMSSITDIISGVSYLLIGFVSISLVVSSIMIGIITYISVLERTKEIGILRAVGASKKDVSRVFNAETLIVGLGAGVLGIVVTLLLNIPINAAIHAVTGLTELSAALPPVGGAILVAISAILTILAGLIPARLAAKKDPVEALRSE